MGNTVGSLTQDEISIILGSVLGDGYLRIIPGRSDAILEINHSFSAKAYVDWKHERLKRIVRTPPIKRKGREKRISYRFSTRQHPDLTKIYKRFYDNKEKIVPDLKLNPLIMAVWFMDDGSSSYKTYYLNTQGFSYACQKKLIYYLWKQYDIDSALNKDKKYHRIRIKNNSAEKLRETIQDHIIPSMRYKLE